VDARAAPREESMAPGPDPASRWSDQPASCAGQYVDGRGADRRADTASVVARNANAPPRAAPCRGDSRLARSAPLATDRLAVARGNDRQGVARRRDGEGRGVARAAPHSA